MTEFAQLEASPGQCLPLGACLTGAGVNFAIVCRHATHVWLALFDAPDAPSPAAEFALSAATHRFGDVWSIHLRDLKPPAYYAYRMAGPETREHGHRFESDRFLIDPYAKALTDLDTDGPAKSIVVESETQPERTPRPCVPMHQTVIYEVHLRGFTRHSSSGVADSGTYTGFIDKIPHLKELGITAIELLPVPECGERELDRKNPATGEALSNYWGYNPIAFFVPAQRYATSTHPGAALDEFRALVDACHEAGIEVILDVVFNHTSEKDDGVHARSFRLIDNALYYILGDKGELQDLTGCHNTFNCNHPVARDLILDCLRYWVTQFGVDGFRFDLASVFYRGADGSLLERSPLVERIAEDPVLRDTKLIAEPWDCAGAYHVGKFGGPRWAEWNDKFRDTTRRFWRNEPFAKNDFVQRFAGSPDLYQHSGRGPLNSINYVTCHDGFTLRDLVSYNDKYNDANGEDNRDGTDANYSDNCGMEGETDDADINALRLRMQKNHLATLFMSVGVPMLLGGDEFSRTQRGNNNAYCQDNEISWLDWSLLDRNRDLFEFCKGLIRFRKENPVFSRDTYFPTSSGTRSGHPGLLWLDERHKPQTWSTEAGLLAGHIEASENQGVALYLMFNATPEDAVFRLPKGNWRVRINTAAPPPNDITNPDAAPAVETDREFRVSCRSLAVLASA